MMEEMCWIVATKHSGSLKGEHGTGRNVAPFVEMEWGKKAYQLMWELKELFDPDYVLNPGVILNNVRRLICVFWEQRKGGGGGEAEPFFSISGPSLRLKKLTSSSLSLSSPLAPSRPPPPTGPRRPRQELEALPSRLPARRPMHRVRLLRVQLPLARRRADAAAADHQLPGDREAAGARGRELRTGRWGRFFSFTAAAAAPSPGRCGELGGGTDGEETGEKGRGKGEVISHLDVFPPL